MPCFLLISCLVFFLSSLMENTNSFNNFSDFSENIENYDADDTVSSECRALLPTLKRKMFVTRSVFEYKGFWFHPSILSSYLSFYLHFQALDTDLILSTIPKAGTTWIKALTFAIANRSRYPLSSPDHPLLQFNPHELILMFEYQYYFKNFPCPDISTLPSPRLLGTHLPFQLLPSSIKASNCKIIYLCRNPKDNFLSLWNFATKNNNSTKMSFEESFDSFCKGCSWFGPFWEHILGYWKASQEMPERVMFLKYEDLREDPSLHVKRLAEFMGFPISREEEIDGVVDQIVKICSFERMRNLEVNKNGRLPSGIPNRAFFGKGKVGESATALNAEMIHELNDIMTKKLAGLWPTSK